MARVAELATGRALLSRRDGATVEGLARGNPSRLGRAVRGGENGSRGLQTAEFLSETAILLLQLFQAIELASEFRSLRAGEGSLLFFRYESKSQIPSRHTTLGQEGNGFPDLQFGYERNSGRVRRSLTRIVSCYAESS
ncbi:MAG: hypothetical protein ACREDE_07420 [Thermoplasmata archaeon]